MHRVAPALFFPLLAPLPMSFFSLLGAVEIGLIFSLVALGVFISFRLLRFPDLTVDGSFPLAAPSAPFCFPLAPMPGWPRRPPLRLAPWPG